MRLFLIMLAVLYFAGATMAQSFVVSDGCMAQSSAQVTESVSAGASLLERAEFPEKDILGSSGAELPQADKSWTTAIAKTTGNAWRRATACPSKVIAFNQ